jgi:hypothetical protein
VTADFCGHADITEEFFTLGLPITRVDAPVFRDVKGKERAVQLRKFASLEQLRSLIEQSDDKDFYGYKVWRVDNPVDYEAHLRNLPFGGVSVPSGFFEARAEAAMGNVIFRGLWLHHEV